MHKQLATFKTHCFQHLRMLQVWFSKIGHFWRRFYAATANTDSNPFTKMLHYALRHDYKSCQLWFNWLKHHTESYSCKLSMNPSCKAARLKMVLHVLELAHETMAILNKPLLIGGGSKLNEIDLNRSPDNMWRETCQRQLSRPGTPYRPHTGQPCSSKASPPASALTS